MAERFEALDAVIGAHAARTDATERKIILGVVQKRIVNRYVAGCGALEHLATILAVAAEKVERQWPWPSIDASDCLIDVAIGHDRQNRAEDFLVKDAHVIGCATYQALRDTARAPPHVDDWACIASAGCDGQSVRVRGAFNTTANYKRFDIVSLDGTAFIARRDNPGVPGISEDGWQQLSRAGTRGPAGERGPRGGKGERGARG